MGTTLKYKVLKVVPVGGAIDELQEDLKVRQYLKDLWQIIY